MSIKSLVFHVFCSVLFWIGDLNYRIMDLEIGKVKSLIERKQFKDLHSYDQVSLQKHGPRRWKSEFAH